ncbi:MAG: tetratricopeptide repeat protein, partial [Deltaproteobacteria bacterium]|nr:tetratricopeptide repeat protein [Deltaproteobacteria bacterium]
LQKQKQWSQAVDEFEAALAALDGDQRALAELGFSAMNAGDYPAARDADQQAARVALDPNVKAAALFNLGTVELKLGDVDAARLSFQRSLELRANKTVQAELVKLGTASDSKPFCPAGMDPCGCVYDYAAGRPDTGTGCDVKTSALLPAAWKIYTVAHMAYVESFVLDEHNNLLFVSARSDDHVRHVGDMAISKVETKSIGAHRVLWIEQSEHATEMITHEDDTESDIDETSDLVTICVLGTATAPTRCPLREVPVDRVYGEGSGKSETVATIELSDGTATVKLVKGPSCCGLDALVGAHKLW